MADDSNSPWKVWVFIVRMKEFESLLDVSRTGMSSAIKLLRGTLQETYTGWCAPFIAQQPVYNIAHAVSLPFRTFSSLPWCQAFARFLPRETKLLLLLIWAYHMITCNKANWFFIIATFLIYIYIYISHSCVPMWLDGRSSRTIEPLPRQHGQRLQV